MKYAVLSVLRRLGDVELAQIALKMGEAHPETFERLLVGDDTERNIPYVERFGITVPLTHEMVYFTQAELDELRKVAPVDKLGAIKRVREITSIGLHDAKKLVEECFM